MKKTRKHPFILVSTALFILLVSGSIMLSTSRPASAAADPDFISGSNVSGEVSTQIPITDLQIAGTGNPSVPVRLHVTSGSLSMTTVTGLTFSSATTGVTLEFSGILSNVNTALASLRYTRASIGSDTLEASLALPGEVFFEGNGHLYEVVSSAGTWTAANAAAGGLTKYGSNGYLATITSPEENAFVAGRLSSAGWFGASDAASEGDWKWVTGPETGTSFWSGDGSGSVVPGQYKNWATGEPNDSGSNEDCAQFLSGGSGEWNDLRCTVTTLPAYVVEYGAPGDLPEVASRNLTITTADQPSTPSAPTATAGVGSASVAFSAPSANGSAITGYTVTSSPGGITATGTSSPITVPGLTAGTSYTFTVVATNALGNSSSSAASNAVTPTGGPVWSDQTLGSMRATVAYSDGVSATGFPTSMTYSVSAGALPSGLSLNTSTGAITGTPTTAGAFSFTISASNGVGSDVTKLFESAVSSAPSIDLELELELNTVIGAENNTIYVSGVGLLPGSEYTVVMESTPTTIGSGLVASDGTFAQHILLPANTPPGSHSVTVFGTVANGLALSDTAWFYVGSNARILAFSLQGAVTGSLPATGSNSLTYFYFAFMMIAMGGAIHVGSRRYRVKVL